MLRTIYIIMMTGFIASFCPDANASIYVIFYATRDGKTGHVGIAVDNYHIIYRDGKGDGGKEGSIDTLATGELVYYDLWPNDDYFNAQRTGQDIPAVYYKLPDSKAEEITLNSLYDKGIPHKEHYPCDGILKLNTTWKQDQWMVVFLDSMIGAHRNFNGQNFNCADFVRLPLEELLHRDLESREFILVGWSTTPNRLYRNLRKLEEVEVIKNADAMATGSFIFERVIYKLLDDSK